MGVCFSSQIRARGARTGRGDARTSKIIRAKHASAPSACAKGSDQSRTILHCCPLPVPCCPLFRARGASTGRGNARTSKIIRAKHASAPSACAKGSDRSREGAAQKGRRPRPSVWTRPAFMESAWPVSRMLSIGPYPWTRPTLRPFLSPRRCRRGPHSRASDLPAPCRPDRSSMAGAIAGAARSCTRWGLPCPVCHQPGGALLPHPFTLA